MEKGFSPNCLSHEKTSLQINIHDFIPCINGNIKSILWDVYPCIINKNINTSKLIYKLFNKVLNSIYQSKVV